MIRALVGLLLVLGLGQNAPIQRFRTATEAVRVDVLVLDGSRPVSGLTAGDFVLTDSGVTQQVDVLSMDDLPVSVMLALDTSTSVTGTTLDRLKDGATAALDAVGPDGRVAVITFASAVTLAGWLGSARGRHAHRSIGRHRRRHDSTLRRCLRRPHVTRFARGPPEPDHRLQRRRGYGELASAHCCTGNRQAHRCRGLRRRPGRIGSGREGAIPLRRRAVAGSQAHQIRLSVLRDGTDGADGRKRCGDSRCAAPAFTLRRNHRRFPQPVSPDLHAARSGHPGVGIRLR